MKHNIKTSLPLPGQYIEITSRTCSDRVSPLLTVGSRFIVRRITALQDGTPVIEVAHPSRRRAVLRVSAARFTWRVMTIEALQEEKFKKDVAADVVRLTRQFSTREQIDIAFVPLIFRHVAWTYAFRAVTKSAEYKVDSLKKISRRIRLLKDDYCREINRDLDVRHRLHIEQQTEQFMHAFAHDFTILWFSVSRELKRAYPALPYDDLRTCAILSMLFIRLHDEQGRRMNGLIASRLGVSTPYIRMPLIDELYRCMEAFAGLPSDGFRFDEPDITMSLKIIENDLNKTEFEIL